MTPNGPLIRRLRLAQGKSLNGFAREIGISGAQLSIIERGKSNTRPETAMKIAQGLGVPLPVVADVESAA